MNAETIVRRCIAALWFVIGIVAGARFGDPILVVACVALCAALWGERKTGASQ